MHLSEYDYAIRHIAGEKNVVADALSRCLVSAENIDMQIDSSEKIVSIAYMNHESMTTIVDQKKIFSREFSVSTAQGRKNILHYYC